MYLNESNMSWEGNVSRERDRSEYGQTCPMTLRRPMMWLQRIQVGLFGIFSQPPSQERFYSRVRGPIQPNRCCRQTCPLGRTSEDRDLRLDSR